LRRDNEQIRKNKRELCDKLKALCEEKEQHMAKLTQYRGSLKGKDTTIKEL